MSVAAASCNDFPSMSATSSLLRQIYSEIAQHDGPSKSPAALDMADVSTAVASDTASPPLSPGNASCGLLSCPWHDAMSYFLTSGDLGRISSSCSAFRTELTVEAPRREE